MTPTQTAPWTAACATCGWTATAATYTAAGEACRAHDCPDPDTTIIPTDEDRDDDLGVTVDLDYDDLPGIDPIAYTARVAGERIYITDNRRDAYLTKDQALTALSDLYAIADLLHDMDFDLAAVVGLDYDRVREAIDALSGVRDGVMTGTEVTS